MLKSANVREWWLLAALLVVAIWLAVAVAIGLAAIIGSMAGIIV